METNAFGVVVLACSCLKYWGMDWLTENISVRFMSYILKYNLLSLIKLTCDLFVWCGFFFFSLISFHSTTHLGQN